MADDDKIPARRPEREKQLQAMGIDNRVYACFASQMEQSKGFKLTDSKLGSSSNYRVLSDSSGTNIVDYGLNKSGQDDSYTRFLQLRMFTGQLLPAPYNGEVERKFQILDSNGGHVVMEEGVGLGGRDASTTYRWTFEEFGADDYYLNLLDPGGKKTLEDFKKISKALQPCFPPPTS